VRSKARYSRSSRRQEPLLTSNQVDIPYAYVIYDHGRTARLALIRDWLANFD
jgi:hypothetical protein